MNKISFLILSLFLINCSISNKAIRTNSLSTPEGKPKYYQSTLNVGIHLVFGIYPVWGDANFEETLNQFTLYAQKNKASKIRLIQKETTKWVYILPPLSFLVSPVSTEIVGEIYE
ncbi:MAG: hypothetical protein H7A25_20890 [Leptospiraceae bacterium]|nr:hypothetical protein [Leptospiraceae bacterium]MCP5502366.1 hypothetical protein [Leptospiraceae bacterium]